MGIPFVSHRKRRPEPLVPAATRQVGVDDRLAARVAGLAVQLGDGWDVSLGTEHGSIVIVPATEPEEVAVLRQRRPGIDVVVLARPMALAPWQHTVDFLDAGADRVLLAPSDEELAAHLTALARRWGPPSD